MNGQLLFITGTDTGVGKTVLSCVLARHLHRRGLAVAALKPLCSGGRLDARLLQAASGAGLALDEVNPWHFRAPLAPLLAARRTGVRVKPTEVLAHIRRVSQQFDCVLVEGAGGLLSPLGEGFDLRDLLVALGGWPLVVCPNRLGAINQSLLVVEALPGRLAARAQVVLMSPRRLSVVTQGNIEILAERLGAARVHTLPWLSQAVIRGRAPLPAGLCRRLDNLLAPIGPLAGCSGRPAACAR